MGIVISHKFTDFLFAQVKCMQAFALCHLAAKALKRGG